MAAGDLCGAADVSAWGGPISGTSADAVVARLITAYSAMIRSYCNTDFQAATSFSEIRDGNGSHRLVLGYVPMSAPGAPASCSIASLTIDQQPIPAQPADGQAGYYQPSPRVLDLFGYRFNRGRGNVRLSYAAGYANVPTDVAQACVELVVVAYRRGKTAGVRTSSTPASGEVTTYDLSPLPASVKAILSPYRLVTPC